MKEIGVIEVITGPMACGKTEELIRRLHRAQYAKQKVVLFKPAKDTRNQMTEVASRNGTSFPAQTISETVKDISDLPLPHNTQIVAFDEIHFFPPETFIPLVETLRQLGFRVILSGLDLDFLCQPFKTTALALAIADKVLKLSAICLICGKEATVTQKIVNGQPAPRSSQRFEAGGDEKYYPTCRACHQIPD